MTKANKATVNIYCCGGTATNIGSRFENYESSAIEADVYVSYIDSSDSNVDKISDLSRLTLKHSGNRKGSGKVRSVNVESLADAVPGHLADHPPADFNIVIYSLDGGSGSVAGPIIQNELIAREKSVVGITTAACNSDRSLGNAKSTMKTLANMANQLSANFVISYVPNLLDKNRQKADQDMYETIKILLTAASDINREMDAQDVYHWLNYTDHSDADPGIHTLDIYTDLDHDETDPETISSVLTLASDSNYPRPDWLPSYSTAGFCDLKTNFSSPGDEVQAIHLVLNPVGIQSTYDDINNAEQSARGKTRARKRDNNILDGTEGNIVNGIVL